MKMTVCVPMYNESAIIAGTARTLYEYMAENFEDYEIIFVDDGSLDGSARTVEELALPNVRVISYSPNRGKGCAVRTGMMEAAGDIAMFVDADLAYGTDVIREAADMLEADRGGDVLIGSRAIHPEGYEGYTAIRKLASKTYIKVLNIAGGLKQSDSQCGCKAFRGKAIKEIFSRMGTDGFAFDFEALLWAKKLGYKIIEMPVKIINHRESKVNVFRDAFRMLGEISKIKKRVKKSDTRKAE